MTTRKQADALRSQLYTLVGRGARTLDNVYTLYPQEQVVESIQHLVMPIVDLAAVLSADWYTKLAPDENFTVSDTHGVGVGRVNYTAVWSYKQSGIATPADRMIGAFQRMVFDASRNVVVANAKAEGVPWHRDARAATECSFCKLLTVNPHAYNGKYVEMPSHNHDCRCIAVASRPGNQYVEPDYVQRWREVVNAEKTGDLTSTLAGMDEHAV